jgi:hypothetical protein
MRGIFAAGLPPALRTRFGLCEDGASTARAKDGLLLEDAMSSGLNFTDAA